MAEPAIAGGMALGVLSMLLLFLSIFIISILAFIFWIFMIIDVAKRDFKQENDKILWILVVVLAGIIGAAIYYFVIKHPDRH